MRIKNPTHNDMKPRERKPIFKFEGKKPENVTFMLHK